MKGEKPFYGTFKKNNPFLEYLSKQCYASVCMQVGKCSLTVLQVSKMTTGTVTHVDRIYIKTCHIIELTMTKMINCLFIYRSLSSLGRSTTGSDQTTGGNVYTVTVNVLKATILHDINAHIKMI